jgi:hypothetical protein
LQTGEDDEEAEEVVVRGRQLAGGYAAMALFWLSTASAKPGMMIEKEYSV